MPLYRCPIAISLSILNTIVLLCNITIMTGYSIIVLSHVNILRALKFFYDIFYEKKIERNKKKRELMVGQIRLTKTRNRSG